METILTDNTEEVRKNFYQQVKLGLEMIGVEAEGYAKEQCPVDTGRLRNSISNKVVDNDVYIGTNVEYAEAVEFRDIPHKTGNAHFLKNAATTHGEDYKKIMEVALKS